MIKKENSTYYILALAVSIGLLFHGASFFNTLENTYDVYVHMFFADHYARNWFEPWENRWYTGFNMISYPPLLHQLIALLSFIGGIKFATYLIAFGIVVLYVTGAFRFAKLIVVNEESAGYAALIAVFLPSVIEAFHVFGQLPMMFGISWLLHALPEVYLYIRYGKQRYFLTSISLIAVGVCSHHVTPIFGMVFFVLPLIGTAIMDGARSEVESYKLIDIKLFLKYSFNYMRRIFTFGLSTIIVTILAILPYWLWSKNDPISQIPIPHGSRDNFIEVFSSGLTFFILPWGFLLLMLPFFFFRLFSKRNLFMGLSFTLLIILGTGGTTPIPRILLGENAFNILTLERFTFWATIYAMPLAGEFLWKFTKGNIYRMILTHRSSMIHAIYVGVLVISIFLSAGFTMNLNFFRPLQPDPIDIKPIENFLESDKHNKWRYLTLGFGDQMAWLSANTTALTIDGNYHSARRIPELTTRAIERLENAKYKGVEGIETLQQFLCSPETFKLKYVFSNDKFYDPILYYSGWHRVKSLDNGIMVWERSDVSPLPSIIPKKDIPFYQKIHWGVAPLLFLFVAFFFNVQMHWIRHISAKKISAHDYSNPEVANPIIEPVFFNVIKYWIVIIFTLAFILMGVIYFLNLKQVSPKAVITSYYDALDFKDFKSAHDLLDPDTKKSLDYFLLERSVTDGFIDSYGKIDNMNHTIIDSSNDYAKIETKIEWVTPLETYNRTSVHEVIKKGYKWYLKPLEVQGYIPTNQFTNVPGNNFLNQGRRKITTEETFHEDVLDRPVVQVRSCKLVKKDGKYYVIGQIQNLDNYPVDITIKSSLLDSKKQILTSYDDKFHLVHKLLPKEVTAFRIEFDAVDWKEITEKIEPSTFNLKVLGTVANQDLYKSISLRKVSIESKRIVGELYNFGSQTVSITQFIQSYYNKNGELIWVDTSISEKSTFPQKANPFDITIADYDLVEVITIEQESIILVNGLPNDLVTSKYLSSDEQAYNDRIPIPNSSKVYMKIQLNNFVGNPAPY